MRVALWAIAFWIGYHLQVRLEHHLVSWREFGYLVAAGAFVFAAAWPRTAQIAAPDAPRTGALARYDRWIAIAVPLCVLGAAAVLGVFFRTHDLNSRPVGIWYDEAQNGLLARRILDGDFPPMFIGRDTQLPSAFFYVYAFAAKVMGEGILSLRAVSTVGGLAALPFVFLLARQLFGLRTGVLAIFLLAVMRWHVNFSRFGVTNIFAATFVLGAMYFFALGLRGGRRWQWSLVAAGVFVGLTPYAGFYGAFVPFVIALYWLHSAMFERVLTLRLHAAAIVIVALTALAIYSPVAAWGLSNGDAYRAPISSRCHTVGSIIGIFYRFRSSRELSHLCILVRRRADSCAAPVPDVAAAAPAWTPALREPSSAPTSSTRAAASPI